jgi:hypothetical protein
MKICAKCRVLCFPQLNLIHNYLMDCMHCDVQEDNNLDNALFHLLPKQPPNTACTRSPEDHRGWRGGSLRVFEQVSWLETGSVKLASSRPTSG